MIEKAEVRNIDDIFKSYYEIPEYQREYSWKENNWDNLYNDIEESEKDYFLGSLICIIDKDNLFKVVDGQQRLTTLSIFRLALTDLLQNNKKQFFENEDLYGLYLNLKSSIYKDKKCKLRLQGNNYQEYINLVEKILNETEIKTDDRKRINKAYSYFREKIEELTIAELFDLLNKINTATVVRIEVKTDQDAFTLFESINNRGKPLSPIDLIKNKLFANLKDIEVQNLKWKEILENIEEYNLQVRFIRQFYNVFKGRGVTGFNKETFKPIDKLPKATITNIITIFDNWIKADTSEDIFKSLIHTSEIYKKLINNSYDVNDGYNNDDINFKLEDLNHLGIAPSYALLMFLIDRKTEDDKFLEILKLLEIWFIRRHLTNNPSTGKLDQIFMDIVNKIEKITKNENSEIIIEKNDRNIVDIIKDELFSQKNPYNTIFDVKNKLSGNIYDDNSSLTMYLLVKLERELNGWLNREDPKQIYFWDTFKNNKKVTPVWSIEHILPQNPKKTSDWYEWWNNENHMTDFVHKLGNLTLTGFNGRLSNKNFEKKKTEEKTVVIDEKTIIEYVGYNSGKIKLNDSIKDNPKWSEIEISARTKYLVETLVKILKYSFENESK